MSDKKHDQTALSRRAALKKLGLGTVAFVAPTVMTVSEAEAKKGGFRYSKSGKRSSRSKSTRSSYSKSYSGEDGEDGEDSPGSISTR